MSSDESKQELNREFVATVERLNASFQEEIQQFLGKRVPSPVDQNAILARMKERIRKHLKCFAKAQRQFSSTPFDDMIFNAAREITELESGRRIPKWLVSLMDRTQQVLIREWESLKSAIEAEEPDLIPLLPPSVTQQIMSGLMTVHRAQRSSPAGRALRHETSIANEQQEQPTNLNLLEFPKLDAANPEHPSAEKTQRRSSRDLDHRKTLVARTKSRNPPGYLVTRIVIDLDKEIERMPDSARDLCAPLEQWCITSGERTWRGVLADPNTHRKVKDWINHVPRLSPNITRKAN